MGHLASSSDGVHFSRCQSERGTRTARRGGPVRNGGETLRRCLTKPHRVSILQGPCRRCGQTEPGRRRPAALCVASWSVVEAEVGNFTWSWKNRSPAVTRPTDTLDSLSNAREVREARDRFSSSGDSATVRSRSKTPPSLKVPVSFLKIA